MLKVNNADRKFGSASEYYHLNHDNIDYLFTFSDLTQAKERALANKSDLPKNESLGDFPPDQPKASLEGCAGIVLAIVGIAAAIIGISIFI